MVFKTDIDCDIFVNWTCQVSSILLIFSIFKFEKYHVKKKNEENYYKSKSESEILYFINPWGKLG